MNPHDFGILCPQCTSCIYLQIVVATTYIFTLQFSVFWGCKKHPTDDSLFKMLYLAMMDITKKWTGRRQDWSMIYAQLVVFFGDRIPE